MSLHRVALNVRQANEPESLVGIIDALYSARDLTNLMALACGARSDGGGDAFGTLTLVIEDALGDIIDRVEAVMHGRAAS